MGSRVCRQVAKLDVTGMCRIARIDRHPERNGTNVLPVADVITRRPSSLQTQAQIHPVNLALVPACSGPA